MTTRIDNQCVGKPTSGSESDPDEAPDEVGEDSPDGNLASPTHIQCESIIDTCTCACCTNLEVSYQPTDLTQSKTQGSSSASTFRLLGTPNTNGLVCAHRLTRYSVRYAVVRIDRDCLHLNLLLFVMVSQIGRRP